jgi:hypothetical protein
MLWQKMSYPVCACHFAICKQVLLMLRIRDVQHGAAGHLS